MPVNTSPQALDNREQILHEPRGRRKDPGRKWLNMGGRSFCQFKWQCFLVQGESERKLCIIQHELGYAAAMDRMLVQLMEALYLQNAVCGMPGTTRDTW